jgi:hypothetical protein
MPRWRGARQRVGEWLAWEGSGAYADGEERRPHRRRRRDRGSPAPRSSPSPTRWPSSAASLPATVLPDIPAHFPTAEAGVLYSPRNYDGAVPRAVCARGWPSRDSENVPAVWTLLAGRRARSPAPSRRAGLTTLDRTAAHYGYALTMGDAEVRLGRAGGRVLRAGRGGLWRAPRDGAAESCGTTAWWSPRAAPTSRSSPRGPRSGVTDVLADPDARSWAFGERSSLDFPVPGGREDGNVAGVTVTTGRSGTRARVHGRRVGGRTTRPRPAAQLVRRHRAAPDLPRRAAGGRSVA